MPGVFLLKAIYLQDQIIIMKATREKIKIIFTDDDQEDCDLFIDAIEQIGINYQLTVFNNGVELLNYLDELSDIPHILFLDLNMPFMNGLESLRKIRDNKKYRDLTIAIYSTSGSDQDQEDTFVSGANVYIKKPSNFEGLKKILNEVLEVNWQLQSGAMNRETYFLSVM